MKIAELPDSTRILCGHEYSENNLQFALSVDPENNEINKKIQEVNFNLSRNKFPLSTIGEEKTYNPFFRLNESSIVDNLKAEHSFRSDDEKSVFIKLRELRNNW